LEDELEDRQLDDMLLHFSQDFEIELLVLLEGLLILELIMLLEQQGLG